jgi:EmrB/QacA subfamily drug resistance transporter
MTVTTTATPDVTFDPNRWAALAVLLIGSFLAPLDFFIVNNAMPAITRGLGARSSDVQLVISGYAVVYGVFLITGGRLGDIYGRKSIFMIGLAGFALASALCGLAWSPLSLIAARMLQALAAAAMAPQALASVHALFPPHERGRALGIYGVTLGLSSIVGQLLGGALVAADIGGYGWRLVFLINVPIVIATLVAAVPLLRETRGAHRPKLDLGGVALSSLALSSFVVPLVEGRERGWPLWSIVMLLTTPFFVEAFRRHEIRLAKDGGDPLVSIEVFQSPGLLRGIAAIMTLYAVATFFLTYSIYLQSALQFSAWQAGLAILPFSAGFLVASTFSGAIGRWLGTATPSLSYLMAATGSISTALVVSTNPAGIVPPWPLILPALALFGFGMGLAIPTMVRVIVERVAPQHAGLVGGLFNSTLQVSAAVGIAVLGGLFYVALGTRTDPAAVTHLCDRSVRHRRLPHRRRDTGDGAWPAPRRIAAVAGPRTLPESQPLKEIAMTTKTIKIPNPDHPITIEPNPNRVTVTVDGHVIAVTANALTLREAAYPPVLYIPRGDVDMTQLARSDHATYCPYKGDCAYYSIPAGEARGANAVWTYEAPFDAVAPIKDYLAFYPDRVDVIDEQPSA